jgi:hypothetical protein
MAEIHVSQDEQLGIKKEIDDGAYGLVFQAIQEDIYSFPIKSFVRETISNGLDSIIEREQAKDIIVNGEDPVKYYRQLTDDKLLKDSSFDEKYYDVNHLSNNNTVEVFYKERSGRDLISITDCGVGLGMERLRGFFKIGYSSKRNMKSVMGKFGSGSKSGLATGVDYFVIHTVYNGYRTSFMVYKNDYEPITPKHSAAKVEQWEVTMANDSVKTIDIYWESTSADNCVTVELEVKKHNKSAYINAVVEQFQYFKGKVELVESKEDGSSSRRLLDNKPYYESKVLLIPNTSTLNAPHILVDGINYGLISWDELELNKRPGRLALKLTASEVDITQSRETLKWTEKTKSSIMKAINSAEEEASEYITGTLEMDNKDNLFEFNNTYSLLNSADDNVSYAFSQFLDMHTIKPKFTFEVSSLSKSTVVQIKKPLDSKLFYELFYMFKIQIISVISTGKGVTIDSKVAASFSDIVNLPIVCADETSLGPKRAQYILESKFPDNDSFVYIRGSEANKNRLDTPLSPSITTRDIQVYMGNLIAKCKNFNLDEEDWDVVETELKDHQELAPTKESREKFRRDNKIVLYQEHPKYTKGWNDIRDSVYAKKECTIKELKNEFVGEELIICTGNYKQLGTILDSIKDILGSSQRIIYVSQQSVKYFLPFGVFITDYMRKYNPKTKELMIGKLLRDLGTLKKFKEVTVKNYAVTKNTEIALKFLKLDNSKYKTLQKSREDVDITKLLTFNYKNQVEAVQTILDYVTLVGEFQKVLKTGDEALILSESKKMFNGEEVFNVDSFDDEFITELSSELERVSVCEFLIGDLVEDPTVQTVSLVNELINLKNQ